MSDGAVELDNLREAATQLGDIAERHRQERADLQESLDKTAQELENTLDPVLERLDEVAKKGQ